MKIVVISFDFWNYDEHIVRVLQEKGIDAHHINIGGYQHKNIGTKVVNAVSKTLLRKNLKNINRQKLILDSLQKLGKQDQILVINPELIPREVHEQIRKYTDTYIAYLYDSLARCPVEHLLDLFDKIFSFDKTDSENNGFQNITNYNYLSEEPLSKDAKYDLVYLASIDSRLEIANKITEQLINLEKSFSFFVSGKKTWINKFLKLFKTHKNGEIIFSIGRLPHSEIVEFYKDGKVILDLVRENQDGLSFRIFEAMALKKKIITNNKTILDYDFYNPNNILLLNDELSNLDLSFFESDYQELPKEIYEKYTLENWVKKVFELK